jgi:hypothetical protein
MLRGSPAAVVDAAVSDVDAEGSRTADDRRRPGLPYRPALTYFVRVDRVASPPACAAGTARSRRFNSAAATVSTPE